MTANNEILTVLEYMEKEKGISREEMAELIAQAVQVAAQRENEAIEFKVNVDINTGALEASTKRTVVEEVQQPSSETTLKEARKHKADAILGEAIWVPLDASYVSRIAAQATRQRIAQRVREVERERAYDEYKDLVGDVVSGVVRYRERGNFLIDLEHAEAIMPFKESIPGENYATAERIQCLLLRIDSNARGPQIILSRSSPNFVKRLFEKEVTEIADGTVVIEALARDPGSRSKVAVRSLDSKVDPVGACVGSRGIRVKSIVRELGGEKLDIVKWHSDPLEMLSEIVKPAVPHNIRLDEVERRIYFEVAQSDLPVAIGRKGQNARLTSKLLKWHLDIGKLKSGKKGFDDQREGAIALLKDRLELDEEKVIVLVDNGLSSIEAFEGVEVADLGAIGLSDSEAKGVISRIQSLLQH